MLKRMLGIPQQALSANKLSLAEKQQVIVWLL